MLLWNNLLSTEKLNLIWNKQRNFNKLGPLRRIFQIELTGRRMGNLPGGFFYQVVGIWQGVILPIQTFFKAKNSIL